MRLTYLQRKLALLRYYCERSPNKELVYPTNRNAKMKIVGYVARNTFDNWLNGRNIPSAQNKVEADISIKKIIFESDISNTLDDRNVLDDNFGVMEFGMNIGLSRSECRFAIDTVIGELAPTFSIFSLDQSTSRKHFQVYQGLYIIYRYETTEKAKDSTGRKSNMIKIPMSVRHELSGHKAASQNLKRIRCKLNVHSFSGMMRMHEYDGYMTSRDSAELHHWVFQSRNDIEDDLIYIISSDIKRYEYDDCEGNNSTKKFKYMNGVMFSRSQDRNIRAVAWPIIIQKIEFERIDYSESNKPEDWSKFDDIESYFMRSQVGIFDPIDINPGILELFELGSDYLTIMGP